MAAVTKLDPEAQVPLAEERAGEPVRRFFRVAFAGAKGPRASGPQLSPEGWRALGVDAFFSASFAGRSAGLNQSGASCGAGALAADQVFAEFNWD